MAERERVARDLVGLEPTQLRDVVSRPRIALDDANGPVQVQRAPAPFSVDVHPDAEELERLDLHACFFSQLPSQALERMLALLQESARKVPEAHERLHPAAR